MKVCFHVDQNERWATCLANIYNTLKYRDEEKVTLDLVVVANSEAVTALKATEDNKDFLQELQAYMGQGLVVQACANALRGHEIASQDLAPGIDVVPAGIIALVQKQEEGYAYIRP